MTRDRDLVDRMGGGRGRAPERTRFDDGESDVASIQLDMVLHHETPGDNGAYLLSDTGEDSRAKWFAKSQVTIMHLNKTSPATGKDGQRTVLPVVTVTIPEWLARKEGLI